MRCRHINVVLRLHVYLGEETEHDYVNLPDSTNEAPLPLPPRRGADGGSSAPPPLLPRSYDREQAMKKERSDEFDGFD